ncbi:MAG: threonine synthase [Vicinamibacteria bacterium]
MPPTLLTHLQCSRCHREIEAALPHRLCFCGSPLLARYDLEKGAAIFGDPSLLRERRWDLWRYEEMLPVADPQYRVSLGEGGTPLVATPRLGRRLGATRLYVKDESLNPTGSFKARGLCLAVSMAKQLGVEELAIPSAGNAGGALAAYAARAGLPCHVVMPRDAPRANVAECEAYGADIRFVDGVITDAGCLAEELSRQFGWFDVSTLKEPYRIEGKKTMGYEIFEQLDGRLPDVIFYPTGGGMGMIGMWKAFEEMEALGWLDSRRPRMVSVQSTGCAPIVRAFESGAESAEAWENPQTIASGLRVPRPIGDFLILRAIRESRGTAAAVTDEAIEEAVATLATTEGIFAAPEGAACLVALETLLERGWVDKEETIVLLNTGSGLKYID